MAQSLVGQGVRAVVVDLVGGVIGFPFWWYSRGLMRALRGSWRVFQDYRAWLGVGIWTKNLFVPMYGSYDIVGRIISFFVRLVMIVLRTIALLFVAVFSIVAVLLYLIAPVVVTGMVIYHATGSLYGQLYG